MPYPRRAILAVPLLLAACGGDEPVRTSFPALRYDYLTPLRLNVATLAMADLPPPGPLDAQSPVPLGAAVQAMARDRLSASGSGGQAVFTVDEARITGAGRRGGGGGLDGVIAVHLDVLTPEGTRAGFAEARVARRSTGTGRDLRGAVYDMTRQMLDDLNIELEFQLRRSLKDWLQDATTAPAPPPVEQQDLRAPGT